MKQVLALLLPLVIAACEAPPLDLEAVAQQCEDRARAAQGPTGSVTVGANSNSGPYTNVAIGISSDYIGGRDPNTVYSNCVQQRTGQAPIRPPRLR